MYENYCSSDAGSFEYFRSKFFTKVISCVKSFTLNEYDLRILPIVCLIEMFDFMGNELKYAKEFLLNHYRKSLKHCMRLQDILYEGGVKTEVTNQLRKMLRIRIHKAA